MTLIIWQYAAVTCLAVQRGSALHVAQLAAGCEQVAIRCSGGLDPLLHHLLEHLLQLCLQQPPHWTATPCSTGQWFESQHTTLSGLLGFLLGAGRSHSRCSIGFFFLAFITPTDSLLPFLTPSCPASASSVPSSLALCRPSSAPPSLLPNFRPSLLTLFMLEFFLSCLLCEVQSSLEPGA